MTNINKKLKNARPRLFTIAPLTTSVCWGFSIVNIVIGLAMIIIYKGTIAPIPIADVLSYRLWGAVFLSMGLFGAISLIRNNWRITRWVQLLGILVKSIWLIALIVRCFYYPQTVLITAVWFFFAYIQAMVYIFFIPSHFRALDDVK